MIKETDWIIDNKIKTDETIFAIGDIHGNYDTLDELTKYVDKNYPSSKKISLGDIIDRGSKSIDCLNYVFDNYDEVIPGNHELLLLGTCLGLEYYSETFFSNGGEWLYFLFKEKYNSQEYLLDILKLELGNNYNKLTQDNKLLLGLDYDPTLHYKSGNILFVHGGIMPGINYIDSIYGDNIYGFSDNSPIWIRDPFLNHKSSYCKDENNDDIVVVHGHSFEHYINHTPGIYTSIKWPKGFTRIDGYRLGLDTGNYDTGIHTGSIIENGRYKILSCVK